MEDAPQPPCHAYREVEAVLAPDYLVAQQPPPTGRKLIVSSLVDRVTSYWEMDPWTARFVFDQLKANGAQVHVTSADYDNRSR